MLSTTVTVEVAVLLFPFTSVTVRVTVFAPKSAQLKVDGLTLVLAMPQASLEPVETFEATMLALPAASRLTVIFCATAVGLMVSITVIVALAELMFPLASVAVKVTIFGPTSPQVKLDWLKA